MAAYKLFNSKAEAQAAIPLNKIRVVVAQNIRICVVHSAAGLFAVEELCPHLGESLSKGTVNYLNEIVCPWHSYRFNLKSGVECKYRTQNLKTYSLLESEDGLYLEI